MRRPRKPPHEDPHFAKDLHRSVLRQLESLGIKAHEMKPDVRRGDLYKGLKYQDALAVELKVLKHLGLDPETAESVARYNLKNWGIKPQ